MKITTGFCEKYGNMELGKGHTLVKINFRQSMSQTGGEHGETVGFPVATTLHFDNLIKSTVFII